MKQTSTINQEKPISLNGGDVAVSQMQQSLGNFWQTSYHQWTPQSNQGLDEQSMLSLIYQNSLKSNTAKKDSAIGAAEAAAKTSVQKDKVVNYLKISSSTKGEFNQQKWNLPVPIKREVPSLLDYDVAEGMGHGPELNFDTSSSVSMKPVNATMSSVATLGGTLGIVGFLAADDATVIGVIDDILIPVVLIAGVIELVRTNTQEKTLEELESGEEEEDKSERDSETVPDKAKDVANQVKENKGVAPKGYKGESEYKNQPKNGSNQKLPENTKYKEYDVNPNVKGQNRGTERIVIGDDGTVWYTNDHYHTFIQIK